MKKTHIKLLSSLLFCLTSGQGFADTLTVSPIDGNNQSTQQLYGNAQEQVPIKVTINYNKYHKDTNDQYFSNLQFNVGDIFTSRKMSDLNINDVCADNPYERISSPTARRNSSWDSKGVKFLNSSNYADPKLYLNKLANKWQDSPAKDGVSFCFTNQRNIFSLGLYNTQNHPRLSSATILCTADGQEHCSISHTYLMQVDARDYKGGALGQSLVQANTALDNGSAPISSGNANENIYIDELDTSSNPVVIDSQVHSKSNEPGFPAQYGYIVKASIDNVHATILAAIMVDDNNDPWQCASNRAGIHNVDTKSSNVHLFGFLTDTKTNSIYMHNSRTYWEDNYRECLFSIDNGAGYNLASAEDASAYKHTTVSFTNYSLGSYYKPGDSFLYLGTNSSSQDPSKFSFRFYILDEYGNFLNIVKIPGH